MTPGVLCKIKTELDVIAAFSSLEEVSKFYSQAFTRTSRVKGPANRIKIYIFKKELVLFIEEVWCADTHLAKVIHKNRVVLVRHALLEAIK